MEKEQTVSNCTGMTVNIKRNIGGTFSIVLENDVFTYDVNDIPTTRENLKKDFEGISDEEITAIISEARSQTSFDNESENE